MALRLNAVCRPLAVAPPACRRLPASLAQRISCILMKKTAWAGGLLVLLIVPYFLQATPIAYVIRLAGIAGLYMLLALGLNLVIGYVGLLDLGFMAFYAIGAYTAAILAIHKVPFVLCVAAAVFASALIRVIIGF